MPYQTINMVRNASFNKILSEQTPKTKKPKQSASVIFSSGDRTRTYDLRVMSPTSYQLLHPAMYFF